MNSKIALTAALLLAGGVGAAAYAGAQTQRDVQAQLAQMQDTLARSGIATLKPGPLHKTLMGGTQDTVVTLFPNTPDRLDITLRSRIHNGPFPQGKSFGAARIVTQVIFPPDVQADLDEAFSGQKITLQTQVQFGGSSVTTYQVPAGQYAEGDGEMTWRALSGTVHNRGDRVTATAQWPGAELRGDGLDLQVGRLSWDFQGVQSPDGLGDSESQFRLERIGGVSGGTRVVLSDLQSKGQVTGDDRHLSSAVQYRVGQLQVDDRTFDQLRLDLSVDRLDRPALVRLGQLGSELDQVPEAELNRLMTDLLRAAPQFQIDRLSVGEGAEEVVVTGRVGFRPGPGANWETLILDPVQLLSTLDVQAQARTGETGLRQLLGLAMEEHEVQAAIDEGEAMGLFVRRGDRYEADLRMGSGGTYLNGQPLE
ncbi:DUF945 family protein [Deinococcus sp. MIMF12]|uniref:DUF945 family protein n=1 Tax=Deinococcus rhizophilus TaxID=3049544 RepID=A0ABT7JEI4_9DEIO|nr:DUF945 family protein [Deinococcus rhizophilus]MDL2343456.1 DUF945 family protein [Deinococcus rhizophilus]